MRSFRLSNAVFNHWIGSVIVCSLLSIVPAPVHADDNGVLTDKKSLLQAPVVDVRLRALKAAVLSGEPKQVAQFFHFPLNVMSITATGELKLVQITTVAEFIEQYPQLVSPLQQQFLSCLTPPQLTFDGFDYSALGGQFWLRDFSQNGKRDFYISTLSQDSALIAPWLTANCHGTTTGNTASDELGIMASQPSTPTPGATTSVENTEPIASSGLRSFRGQSAQHRIEVTEVSAGKWRYQSWLLTQSEPTPALEIIGAKVLAVQGPVLQFKRGKYRYRFIGPQVEPIAATPVKDVASRLEIYYNDKLLRTEIINAQQ